MADARDRDEVVLAMVGVSTHARLSEEQGQRLTCLAVVLDLVAGRSVPIQVVERITYWAYNGEHRP